MSARRRPRPPAHHAEHATRFSFFAGKGGTGKTTCAAAAAVAHAERGHRVAVISTDPAHSLGDALGRRLGPAPRRVPTRAGRLDAVELDADRALARWLGHRRPTLRTIAERGTYLDDEDLERLLRLSFPGVDELMALVELGRLARHGAWDVVVVDTAPTGHTLRLLAMPQTLQRIAAVLDDLHAKHKFLTDSLGRGYRAGAPDRLIEALDADGRRLAALLRDPAQARFTWLLLPEALSLEEARDGVAALAAAGITVAELVVNRLTPPSAAACAACAARRAEEARVLGETRRAFPALPLRVLPALDAEPRGVPALRKVGRLLSGDPKNSRLRGVNQDVGLQRSSRIARTGGPMGGRLAPPLFNRRGREHSRSGLTGRGPAWLDTIAPDGVRLLVFAGKGGVGKTTCAAAAALALAAARPEARVLALSVDPAHSLGDVLGVALSDEERAVPGAPPGLRAREVEADRALARLRARYQAAIEETFESLLRGSRFDVAYDREALRGLMDLAPPGLDELFAVLSIVEALLERHPPVDVVVLDTAPTGHALRLLEMPATALGWVHALLAILLKYREVVGLGEVAAELVATARRLRELGALLTDAGRARAVAVTRAAELPQRETARLLARLARLRIAVPAVVVNARGAEGCPRCAKARRAEARLVAALRRQRATGRRPWGIISTPAVAPPPRGVAALARWAHTWKPE
ncbi:MAG TPA: TRC40/GET3/ArsA family transport-energizing ATPase [Methylomirabilota bacterium]